MTKEGLQSIQPGNRRASAKRYSQAEAGITRDRASLLQPAFHSMLENEVRDGGYRARAPSLDSIPRLLPWSERRKGSSLPKNMTGPLMAHGIAVLVLLIAAQT